jgi:hypothetical protein
MPDLNATHDLTRLPASAPGGPRHPAAAERPVPRSRSSVLAVLRNLDVVLLVIAAPIALALGAPVFGCLVGAGGWLLQRALAVVNRRLIDRAAEPGSRLGLNFIDAFARIWLLAGAIILAGAAGHRSDGLAAALVICIMYSIAFAPRIAGGRPQGAAER